MQPQFSDLESCEDLEIVKILVILVSTDELKKAQKRKKLAKILKCHIFASIRLTDKYNHLKWGGECHFFRLEPS